LSIFAGFEEAISNQPSAFSPGNSFQNLTFNVEDMKEQFTAEDAKGAKELVE